VVIFLRLVNVRFILLYCTQSFLKGGGGGYEPVAKFLVRDWCIVDFGIGLSYRPASLRLEFQLASVGVARVAHAHVTCLGV
jgi:hypothetical protein